MTINLEEIISAAVEKRIDRIVEEFVSLRPEYAAQTYGEVKLRPTPLENAVAAAVNDIARDEIGKHEGAIRKRIQAVLAGETPARIQIDAYSKIELEPLPTKGETL